MIGHLAYLAALIALALAVTAQETADLVPAVLVLGVIGIWRYCWAALNFARAALYIGWVYPRKRDAALRAHAARGLSGHAYVLVTTYKIAPAITTRVYRSIFLAAARSRGGATVVASVVDAADARLVQEIFARLDHGPRPVKLILDRIPGTGKRDAIARSLRLIAREAPSRRDVVIFVDGDSCVPADIMARAAPFFDDPSIGALTTDERVEIEHDGLFRAWFDLRFIQRQVMMASMALGGRVLTLTGRMSVIRADLATDPSFIRQVEADSMDHWRLGHIRFLTGDDKSTWFWLLARGYQMTYLPDVRSVSMETQPLAGFGESAFVLMRRWFGNMMRTNARALALGPGRIGAFTWWSILDQRLSIWTTLAGPMAVMATAILVDPLVIPAYVAWVMFTRYLFCAVLALFRGHGFPIIQPPLLYFSQISGAAIKSAAIFRLDHQKWTRQAIGQTATAGAGAWLRRASSTGMQTLALGWLLLGVFVMTGLL